MNMILRNMTTDDFNILNLQISRINSRTRSPIGPLRTGLRDFVIHTI